MIKFKPFGLKYKFDNTALIHSYPGYMHSSLEVWLWNILKNANMADTASHYLTVSSRERYITPFFLNTLRVELREVFPQDWTDFVRFCLQDPDRMSNVLAFCLQNFSKSEDAGKLEYVLSHGGSGYKVTKTDVDASEYDQGVYDLTERVPAVIQAQSKEALNSNQILLDAWNSCYSRNPDYEKVVVKCQNFLEELLRDKYEPGNTKPQLGKLIGNLKSSSKKLSYKGDIVVTDKAVMLLLIDNIAQFRGMHTAGSGKVPTKEEAEYVLHTTIYIWNLHQR